MNEHNDECDIEGSYGTFDSWLKEYGMKEVASPHRGALSLE